MGVVPDGTSSPLGSTPAHGSAVAEVWIELARAHLLAGRPLVAKVSGLSMWPLIRPGQRIVIAPRGRLARGDLALVVLGRSLVLHRVIAMSPQGLVTKGDAMPTPDPEVAHADVLGQVPGGPLGPLIANLSSRGGAPLAALLRRLRMALPPRL